MLTEINKILGVETVEDVGDVEEPFQLEFKMFTERYREDLNVVYQRVKAKKGHLLDDMNVSGLLFQAST